MKFSKCFLILLGMFLFLGFVSSIAPVALSDQGTGVRVKSTGSLVQSGSIRVEIYGSLNGTDLIYSESFPSGIQGGRWNLMLGGNPSNPLFLDFGKIYYKDYSINGVDVDFRDYAGNLVERQFFVSPVGTVPGAGYFVGKTNYTTTGNFEFNSTSGYDAANKLCSDRYYGSHLCSEFEIVGSIGSLNISSFDDWLGTAWVSAGGAKYSPAETPANDCDGFSHGVPGGFLGTFWIFEKPNGGKSALGHCGNDFALACCR